MAGFGVGVVAAGDGLTTEFMLTGRWGRAIGFGWGMVASLRGIAD